MPVQSDILVRRLRKIPELSFQEELRGYSKHQVDMVLESLAPAADELERLQSRVAEAETRAASAEARMMEAGGRAEDLASPQPRPEPAAAPEVTEMHRPVAGDTSDDVLARTSPDFDETLRKTLLLAQRTADEVVQEARQEADEILNGARTQANELMATAERESEEALRSAREDAAKLERDTAAGRAQLDREISAERRRLFTDMHAELAVKRSLIEDELSQVEGNERDALVEQIADLEGIRTGLATDIEVLERFLDSRRAALAGVVADLQGVMESPDRLRAVQSPTVTALVVPNGSQSAISVTSDTLHVVEAELKTAERVDAALAPSEAAPSDAGLAGSDAAPLADPASDVREHAQTDYGDGREPGDPTEEAAIDLIELDAPSAGLSAETVTDNSFGEDRATGGDNGVGEYSAAGDDASGLGDDRAAGDEGMAVVRPGADATPEAIGEADTAFFDQPPVPPVELRLDGPASPPSAADMPSGADTASEDQAVFGDAVSDANGGWGVARGRDLTGDHTPQPRRRSDDAPIGSEADAEVVRPSWADAVPAEQEVAPASRDPFLDQLRRVTGDDADSETFNQFFKADTGDDRRGWFGRRR